MRKNNVALVVKQLRFHMRDVWDTEIWQNLREDERGWHAADGSTRQSSQCRDGSTLGGNLDTIAIECIGDRKLSEDTTAKMVA